MSKVVLCLILLGLAACTRSEPPGGEQVATVLPAGMTRVTDVSLVCMVNDQFMGRAQIPIDVEGRTYYGCCPACKQKLADQPAARTAQDPVTGEPVDKARAVIVQDATGNVLYFASEDTLRRFRG